MTLPPELPDLSRAPACFVWSPTFHAAALLKSIGLQAATAEQEYRVARALRQAYERGRSER